MERRLHVGVLRTARVLEHGEPRDAAHAARRGVAARRVFEHLRREVPGRELGLAHSELSQRRGGAREAERRGMLREPLDREAGRDADVVRAVRRGEVWVARVDELAEMVEAPVELAAARPAPVHVARAEQRSLLRFPLDLEHFQGLEPVAVVLCLSFGVRRARLCFLRAAQRLAIKTRRRHDRAHVAPSPPRPTGERWSGRVVHRVRPVQRLVDRDRARGRNEMKNKSMTRDSSKNIKN